VVEEEVVQLEKTEQVAQMVMVEVEPNLILVGQVFGMLVVAEAGVVRILQQEV
jgi:hypothetical protein